MDPTGSQLDSDFSQQDTPCLIIEDSQPESQVLEDNADSHFSMLSRHLPNLQIHKENPVLVSDAVFEMTGVEFLFFRLLIQTNPNPWRFGDHYLLGKVDGKK